MVENNLPETMMSELRCEMLQINAENTEITCIMKSRHSEVKSKGNKKFNFNFMFKCKQGMI